MSIKLAALMTIALNKNLDGHLHEYYRSTSLSSGYLIDPKQKSLPNPEVCVYSMQNWKIVLSIIKYV